MPTIRAIFFDAVATLIHPTPSVGEVYARAGRHHGFDLAARVIGPRFRLALLRQEELDIRLAYRTSEERERERWRSVVAEVFHDQAEPTAPFAELWDHFGHPEAWACYPDVADALAACRRRGLTLGIASNFDARLRIVAAGLPKLQALGPLIISSKVGWRKPAPEFFQALLGATEAAPSEVLLVGDDRVNDFAGGRAAGLATALLVRKQSHVIDGEINSLAHLPHWLDRESRG